MRYYDPTGISAVCAAISNGAEMNPEHNKQHDRLLTRSMKYLWISTWICSWSVLGYLTYLILR